MWEQGWELIQREGPWSFVHSGFIQLFVRTADEIRSRRARVGQQVEVRMPCLREGLMPGFLYAFARAGGIDPAAAHVRIYLNVQAETAARIFQTLLTAEPFERLRFEMKMPSTRAAFSRCDTMVVYAEPSNAHRLLRQLRALKRTFPRGWRSPTPFAAWEIEPGIALAESPPLAAGAAQSFGQHRSGLVARAVVEGLAFKERTAALWAARLCALLQTEGIDPQRPHRQRLEPAFWDRLIRS